MAYEATGDVFCFMNDYEKGDQLISEMQSTFNNLRGQFGDPTSYDFVNRFATSVNAILTARANVTSLFGQPVWGSSYCTVRDLGLQAQDQTNAMIKWANDNGGDVQTLTAQNQTLNKPDLFGSLSDLAKYLVIGAVIVGGIVIYSKVK